MHKSAQVPFLPVFSCVTHLLVSLISSDEIKYSCVTLKEGKNATLAIFSIFSLFGYMT